MLGTGRRWGRIGAGSLATLVVLALAHPAVADSTVTVRGTDLPVGTALAHVGCASPYAATGSLRPYVAQVPGAPLGERSLGVDPAVGSAAGPVAYTGSVADIAVASVAVHAPAGATGVVWVGYQAPTDAGTSHVWFGRAPLSIAGGWSRVSAVGGTLEWTQRDAETGEVLAEAPAATVADMVAERGDGAGLYALGLGCDGSAVDLDAFRFGASGDVTTYDLEGLATSLTMLGARQEIVAGDTVTLRGNLTASGDVDIPHATAILERRDGTDGAGGPWQTVRVVDADRVASAVLEPPVSGTYRWRFVDRPLAEASTSAPVVVDVAAAVSARAGDDAVTGRVSPGDAGRLVELRPAGHPEVGAPVATARTSGDGSFSIPTADVEKGRYVVSTPAALGNTRGLSAPVEAGSVPPSEPTPTPSPSATPTATRTPDVKPTDGPTGEPTGPGSATPTPKPAETPTPARTPEPSPTAMPTSALSSLPPTEEPLPGGSPTAAP